MFLVVEEVDELQEMQFLRVAISVDVPEQLDFVYTLVHVILVVLDDFQTNHLFGHQVQTLDGFAESRRPEEFNDLVATRDN